MITKNDLINILQDLSKKRPLFHSEADFQYAFAWALHSNFKNIDVRLERRTDGVLNNAYIDIILIENSLNTIAIELKYKTKFVKLNFNFEEFLLKNQGAQDCGKYDFLKDMMRLEYYKSQTKYNCDSAFVVFLTNDKTYWVKNEKNLVCKDFSIEESRIIPANSNLDWNDASAGTKKSREKPLKLNFEYVIKWFDYSNIECEKNNKFRYILLQIK